MAINYTKTAWVNGTPPAINHTNLNKLENVAKACADELDALGVESTLADKTTAVGDDQLLARDSADGNKVKKITVANLRASVATATPTASKIPIADEFGKLDGWVSDATTSVKGKVRLATSAELESGTDASKALTPAVVRPATIKRTKMPDGATAVYSQDAWATTDGWGTYDGTISVSTTPGSLRFTATGTGGPGTPKSIAGIRAKTVCLRYKTNFSNASSKLRITCSGGSVVVKDLPQTTAYQVAIVRLPASFGSESIWPFITNATVGDWFEIDWIWVGDYSYLAGSLTEEAARVVNQLGDTGGVGAKAYTTLTSNGTNVSNGDKVTIANKDYTYKTTLTPAEGEVLIGATYTDSLDNLVAAITGGAGNGTLYYCAAAHPLVTASRSEAVVTITALQPGILGNRITTAKSAATLTLANPAGGTSTLAGGVDDWGAKAKFQLGSALGAGAQVGALPNRTNSNIIGYYNVVDCAAGAQVTLPAGGTWAWMVETYGATYNGVKCGTAAGGAAITGTASANLVMYYERIA